MVSANASYERSAQDLPVLTGMNVSRGTQQRLVHRQTFDLPVVEATVAELSLDGGKVRIRTPLGEVCRWQDYKAVNLHEHCQEAFLQENAKLVAWVNQQSLATPLVCLGDGHDGIWNLVHDIATADQRQEILDWFHLVENLHKVGGSERQLERVEALLWNGNVDAAIEQSQPGGMNESIPLLPISPSIVIGLSITATFKQKGFQLGQARSNQPSSKLGHASSSQAHSGKPVMFLKFCCSVVPTSMDSSQIKTCKTGMHPV